MILLKEKLRQSMTPEEITKVELAVSKLISVDNKDEREDVDNFEFFDDL